MDSLLIAGKKKLHPLHFMKSYCYKTYTFIIKYYSHKTNTQYQHKD